MYDQSLRCETPDRIFGCLDDAFAFQAPAMFAEKPLLGTLSGDVDFHLVWLGSITRGFGMSTAKAREAANRIPAYARASAVLAPSCQALQNEGGRSLDDQPRQGYRRVHS